MAYFFGPPCTTQCSGNETQNLTILDQETWWANFIVSEPMWVTGTSTNVLHINSDGLRPTVRQDDIWKGWNCPGIPPSLAFAFPVVCWELNCRENPHSPIASAIHFDACRCILRLRLGWRLTWWKRIDKVKLRPIRLASRWLSVHLLVFIHPLLSLPSHIGMRDAMVSATGGKKRQVLRNCMQSLFSKG